MLVEKKNDNQSRLKNPVTTFGLRKVFVFIGSVISWYVFEFIPK